MIFAEVLRQARRDGKLPAHLDVAHVANVAQSFVIEGARHWTMGAYGDRSFAEFVGARHGRFSRGLQRRRSGQLTYSATFIATLPRLRPESTYRWASTISSIG